MNGMYPGMYLKTRFFGLGKQQDFLVLENRGIWSQHILESPGNQWFNISTNPVDWMQEDEQSGPCIQCRLVEWQQHAAAEHALAMGEQRAEGSGRVRSPLVVQL